MTTSAPDYPVRIAYEYHQREASIFGSSPEDDMTKSATPAAPPVPPPPERMDFTRQWLRNDIKSWYADADARPPTSPDTFDRERNEPPDADHSGGSASAEVAAIISHPRPSHLKTPAINVQQIVVETCGRSSAHGSVNSRTFSPRRYRAVLEPSPIRYANWQSEANALVAGMCEQQQAPTSRGSVLSEHAYQQRYMPSAQRIAVPVAHLAPIAHISSTASDAGSVANSWVYNNRSVCSMPIVMTAQPKPFVSQLIY
jgi:hypothetical protein